MSHDSTSPGRVPESDKSDPQPSNTGVTGKISCSIDWLSYSAAISGLEWFEGCPIGVLPNHEAFSPSGEKIRPLLHYNQAQGLLAGRVDWHSTNPLQGLLVSLTGRDCQLAHAQGVDFLEVLSHALYGLDQGHISRLDFAVDVFAPVLAQDIERAWVEGRVTSPAKRAHPMPQYDNTGKTTGYTFYIGSPSSERKLRIYDKAAAEGVPGPWVRIELETKGDYAQSLAQSMLISGIPEAGRAFLRAFVQVTGVEWFTDALAGPEPAWLEPIVRPETDRQRWYREQILPSIESDLYTGNRWVFSMVQALLDEVDRAIEEHGGVFEVPPKLENSPKWFKGVQVLERDYGLAPGRFSFRLWGKEVCLRLLDDLGYTWDKSAQKWVKRL